MWKIIKSKSELLNNWNVLHRSFTKVYPTKVNSQFTKISINRLNIIIGLFNFSFFFFEFLVMTPFFWEHFSTQTSQICLYFLLGRGLSYIVTCDIHVPSHKPAFVWEKLCWVVWAHWYCQINPQIFFKCLNVSLTLQFCIC